MAEEVQANKALARFLRGQNVVARIEEVLGERAPQFVSTLISISNSNVLLRNASPESLLGSAMTAATLDLPITPSLGYAYIVPYNNKKVVEEKYTDNKGVERVRKSTIWVTEAQFQMGYKGFIQLAQRSGHYQTINATDVREGEIISQDRLSGEIEFAWMEDVQEREKLPVIGYASFFRLTTGFTKTMYMSNEDLQKHAKKYSQSYKKGYGLWVDNFDAMAIKTVLKLLISKYGPMSVQMQQAILADQAATGEDGFEYVDNLQTTDHLIEAGEDGNIEVDEKHKQEEEKVDEA